MIIFPILKIFLKHFVLIFKCMVIALNLNIVFARNGFCLIRKKAFNGT